MKKIAFSFIGFGLIFFIALGVWQPEFTPISFITGATLTNSILTFIIVDLAMGLIMILDVLLIIVLTLGLSLFFNDLESVKSIVKLGQVAAVVIFPYMVANILAPRFYWVPNFNFLQYVVIFIAWEILDLIYNSYQRQRRFSYKKRGW